MLITLSGIDGSGKSTLATKLETELVKKGKRVVQMEFPYSKNWLILERLKCTGNYFEQYGIDNSYVGYMINFERMAFITDYVLPNLECYDYVILQRYFIDFAAIGKMQGAKKEETLLLIDMYEMIKCKTLSFCIDITHEEAYKRICNRGLSCEVREDEESHSKLALAYKTYKEKNYFNNIFLDGEKNPDELVRFVLGVIE